MRMVCGGAQLPCLGVQWSGPIAHSTMATLDVTARPFSFASSAGHMDMST